MIETAKLFSFEPDPLLSSRQLGSKHAHTHTHTSSLLGAPE